MKGQPLRNEAVERRQRRNSGAADQKDERSLRHAVDETAQMLHVAFAGRGEHPSSAKEQQALEQRMVEHVQKRRGQRQCRGKQHALRLERQREPQPDEDDADIFNGVVGKEPLEIVLHQCVQHAHEVVMPATVNTTMLHHHDGVPARSNTIRTKP